MNLGDLCAVFKTEWQLMKSTARLAACILICAVPFTGAAQAQTVKLNVDSSLAELILDKVCSGGEIDEDELRALPVLQSQIKHHTGQSDTRNIEAFLTGLKAAAQCETVEDDVYNFAPVVKEKEKFAAAVAFFTGKAGEIEDFVVESLTPYAPDDLDFEGELVLSIVGNPCGGFSMDGRFYLALNCLRDSYEADYMAAKVVSAHETYHAAQYVFFHPFSEYIEQVKTVDDALDYLFLNLLLEGTAEYVADSRKIDGEGKVSKFFQEFARKGYRNLAYNFRLVNYAADILGNDDALLRRIKDVYRMGFSGAGGQGFYYVGAAMAGHIEESYGREALVCIMGQPPEQFVRAYQATALAAPGEATPAFGKALMKAANGLSKKREPALRYESCVS
ncbi:DUF5700 domain-containing putative Zn-dependent protease [Hyphococcus sp.]|uniref:DUF5700 domain-containing putative Zn-dependent protease n=1 Tax=Hyphococcus sp. TaxID=2038636 RepID=UPI002083D25C|nr:MAG: hypothetical protein DHS20C04_31740 [Marinicaulis sp.]